LPAYCPLTGASFVALDVSTPSIGRGSTRSEAPLLHRIKGQDERWGTEAPCD
jgi:hypothetical protein